MSNRLIMAVSGVAALALILMLGLALRGDPPSGPFPPKGPPEHARHDERDHDERGTGERQIIPLREAAGIAHRRFRGRLIAARLKPPTPAERARGVGLVHELKLLTARRDVLLIRLDARSGAFLEVAGSGLTEARRKTGDDE